MEQMSFLKKITCGGFKTCLTSCCFKKIDFYHLKYDLIYSNILFFLSNTRHITYDIWVDCHYHF